MAPYYPSDCCDVTTASVVCHCLQITEDVLVEAVAAGVARTLCQIRELTGAGTGCTACHRRLKRYLAPADCALENAAADGYSPPPICSVR